MRQHKQIDYTTLSWVKPELDETLKLARQALEIYVEQGEEPSQLRSCATLLHQVNGTLRMVELYGGAMVAEEMERLARAVIDNDVKDNDEAYAALMRGIVQLPDYLERLQSGFRDIPIVLLPLLNELRSARGETGVSESALFSPDLAVALPPSAVGPGHALPADELKRRAQGCSQLFQTALLQWLKDDSNTTAIRDLADVCEQLVEVTEAEPARRLFWVAAGTLDALARGLFEVSKPLKQTLARVERDIKRLASDGDGAFKTEPPLDLTRQLLYFVAHAPTNEGRIGEVRRVFGLDAYLPSEREIEHARTTMAGQNRALLSTVATAIKEDLQRVKDTLDLYLRDTQADLGALGPQVDTLDRVADTLGMLGLGVPRRVVQDQQAALQAIVTGDRQADESTMLDIAGALLYVEASLDEQVLQLGGAEEDDAQTLAVKPQELMANAETRQVMDILAKEAINNFTQARNHFVAFVETHWDHTHLSNVPHLLDEVAGALRILDIAEGADYLRAIRVFTQFELISRRRVPNGKQMDRLADALASMEYFLESVRDRRSNRDQILTVARQSLEALGYWPIPEESLVPTAAAMELPVAEAKPAVVEHTPQPVIEAPSAAVEVASEAPEAAETQSDAAPAPGEAESAAAAAAELSGAGEQAEQAVVENQTTVVDESVAAAVGGSQLSGFDIASSEEIDEEIREIFLEEFDEEIERLGDLIPKWSADHEQLDHLRPIRRVFHTLKGSGRLVGAKELGEFSWKVESMLNRVLDGSRTVSPAVVGLTEQAYLVLPLLRAALSGEQAYADVAGIMDAADRIAAGDEAPYVAKAAVSATASAVAASPVESKVAERTEEVESIEADATIEQTPAEEADIESDVAQVAAEPEIDDEPVGDDWVDFQIDSVLYEILKPEVDGHLETVDAWLKQTQKTSQPVTDALMRSVHTMNGAFGMTEVETATAVTSPLEGYLRRAMSADVLPDEYAVELIAKTGDAVRSTVKALGSGRGKVPQFAGLAEAICALRDRLPKPETPMLYVPEDEEEDLMPTAVPMDAPDTQQLPSFSEDEEESVEAVQTDELSAEPHVEEGEVVISDSSDEMQSPAEEFEAAAGDDSLESLSAMDLQLTEDEIVVDEQMLGDDLPADVASESQETERVSLESFIDDAGVADSELAAELAMPQEQDSDVKESEPEVSAQEPAEAELSDDELLAAMEAEEQAEAASRQQADAELSDEELLAELEAEEIAETAATAEVSAEDLAELEAEQTAEAGRAGAQVFDEMRIAREAEEAERIASHSRQFSVDVPLADDPADPEEPLDMSDIDPDLLEIFLEESNDLLDHSDGLLAGLRDRMSDSELIVGLQRDLHTLKGGARMAGVFPLGELGHAMESLLEAVADGKQKMDPVGVIVLERAFDRLHSMVTRVTDKQAISVPHGLIDQIDLLSRGQSLSGPVKAEDGKPDSAKAEPVRAAKAKAALKPLSAPIDEATDDDESGALRAGQEQVRVRSDLLDQLVNYAGEVAIYRARLEQQLGSFRSNLVELDQTTERIREQLRRLEMETEAQIVARYQREGDTGPSEFDPLELDRFSTQQQLSRSLAESANDLMNLQTSLDDLTRQHESLLLQQSRVSTELQEGLMRTRMLPFESLVPRLRRVLRQACTDTGKQAQLRVDGASGEMDRSVLDRMTAPLEHMLRNAIAHGLELPQERKKDNKPGEGMVRISVAREGSEVVLKISDDGRGLDRKRIFDKAVERGLVKADAKLSDSEVFAFILEAGFSTADSVTRLSGRGVGMDVVYSEIRQLGGALLIDSEPGKGSVFTVRLPFTLAVTQAVFIKIGETTYAVPITSVQGVSRLSRELLDKHEAGKAVSTRYGNEDYDVFDLGQLLGQSRARASEALQVPLLLSRSGELRAAICVDEVLGSREIVVKPVGPQISSVTGIFGATIMGDGSVVVILDVAPLARRSAQAAIKGEEIQPAEPQPTKRRIPHIMVVDDSITMRKVTGRVLERHNFEVSTAKDGIDAIEKMAERVPDLMLLDIEMPRMDGYELAQTMRSDPRMKDVPIVMITSRTGDKHRQRAFDIGVDRYLGKPYQEPELMRQVFELLAEVVARD